METHLLNKIPQCTSKNPCGFASADHHTPSHDALIILKCLSQSLS